MKNKLYKKFLKSPNKINEITYKRYRNKFNKLKDAAKKEYYNKQLNESKSNSRQTWKNEVINRKRSKEGISHKFKGDEGEVITDLKEIANMFNEYFVYVGPNVAAKIPTSEHTC